MATRFVPIRASDWKKGDYRMAASLKAEYWSIEALAAKINAEIEHFDEPGLGKGKAFSACSSNGQQVGFDEYGQEYGPNLLLRFENGTCRKSEINAVLNYFGVLPEHVYWVAPEATDA